MEYKFEFHIVLILTCIGGHCKNRTYKNEIHILKRDNDLWFIQLHFTVFFLLNLPVQCVPVHPFLQPVLQFPVSTEHGKPCLQWPQSKVQLSPYLYGSHSETIIYDELYWYVSWFLYICRRESLSTLFDLTFMQYSNYIASLRASLVVIKSVFIHVIRF